MPTLSCTTIAGRHAAEQARLRVTTDRRESQDDARQQLVEALTRFGLDVRAHLQPELADVDRTIWTACRVHCARADHESIYAILDLTGWRPDRARLSRHQLPYDVVRLRHPDTDATLVLIIKAPFGEAVPSEAA